MLEKMNEPAGPLFTAVLCSLAGLAALALLGLGILSKIDERYIKTHQNWYNQCRDLIHQGNPDQAVSDYQLTQSCFQAAQGITHSQIFKAAITEMSPQDRETLRKHIANPPFPHPRECKYRSCTLDRLLSS